MRLPHIQQTARSLQRRMQEKGLYAIQFHPEVLHTAEGNEDAVTILCWASAGVPETGRWMHLLRIRLKKSVKKSATEKCFCALSGGVDSSVAAGLLSKAIGKQLTCVFVDHGLLRKNEGDEVEAVFGPNGQFDLNFIRVNAQQRYYE